MFGKYVLVQWILWEFAKGILIATGGITVTTATGIPKPEYHCLLTPTDEPEEDPEPISNDREVADDATRSRLQTLFDRVDRERSTSFR